MKLFTKYKTYLLIAVLVVLVAILYIFSLKTGSLNKRDISFAVDKQDVTKVEVVKGEEPIMILEQSGDIWQYNKRYKSSKRAVKDLFESMSNLSIQSPVSKAAEDTLVNILRNSYLVSIYNDSRIIKQYYFKHYKHSSITYMMLKGADKPFAVHVAGYKNEISRMYLSGDNTYRDKSIFNISANDIEELNCITEKYSFELNLADKTYTLLSDNTKSDANISNANRYLTYFTNVKFEKFADDSIVIELKKQIPKYKWNLKTRAGRQIELAIYSIKKQDNSIDMYRVYGIIDNSDEVLIIKYLDLDSIIKKPEYFK